MEKKEYNQNALNTMISSETSLKALLGLMKDMDLEILDITPSFC